VLPRRAFLGRGLTLLALGFARRLWAQGLRFLPLSRPVTVPLADLATPWRARPFVAEATTLATAANPNQPIRVSGMVVRIAAGSGTAKPEEFCAVCVRCPHEGCDCDFVADPKTLPPEVVAEVGHPVSESVFMCPCHNSTFKAQDGERLAGPAPRGLYRFRVTNVTDAAVEIAEVEEDVLIFV